MQTRAGLVRSESLSGPDKRVVIRCSACSAETDAFQGTARHKQLLCRTCYGKGTDKRPRELNALSGKQWAAFSKSVEEYPDTRSDKQRQHGACFPISLARQQIEIYTKPGDVVIDPFVGIGTTLDAAMVTGRRGIGVDINPAFTKVARRDIAARKEDFLVLTGDSRRLQKLLGSTKADFLLTSPPYAHLLRTVKGNFAYKWKEHSKIAAIRNPVPYSAKDEDVGNLAYPEFLNAITEVMHQSTKVLKREAYSVWIVKDFRDLKNGVPLVNFHGDVIASAEQAGLRLWDIRIYDQTKFRPLVCLGYPSKNYYLNLGHSYILVFRNQ
jgi:DNA modification methylase